MIAQPLTVKSPRLSKRMKTHRCIVNQTSAKEFQENSVYFMRFTFLLPTLLKLAAHFQHSFKKNDLQF